MAKVFPPNPFTVKFQGRVFLGAGAAWFTQSASSIEFNAVAKALAVTLIGDETARVPHKDGDPEVRARYAIYVDGKLFQDGIMDAPEKNVILFNSQGVREAKVKIVKLSEARYSNFGLKGIITDAAAFVTPETQRDLKLEFIGDSITCGYGIDAKADGTEFSTATEDATKTYAYHTAEELNADLSVFAYSGYGVLSGSSDDGSLVSEKTIPPYYETVAYCENSKVTQGKQWNFQFFHPGVVVINLGTNDSYYTQTFADRKEDFCAAYANFIKQVREKNPNAYIICTLGMMEDGESLCEYVEKAVNNYTTATKDHRVSYFHMEPITEKEGFALFQHPTEKTNLRCAQALTAYIKKVVLKIKD